MSNQPSLDYKDSVLSIRGDVSFQTVTNLYNQLKPLLIHPISTIDCASIGYADSTAVSLLLAIEKHYHQSGLRFINLNQSIQDLIKLYELDAVLSL